MFYRMIWFVVILFLFLPAAAAVFMWIRKKWSKGVRVILTIIAAVYAALVIAFLAPSNEEDQDKTDEEISEEASDNEQKESQESSAEEPELIIDQTKNNIKEQYKQAFDNLKDADVMNIQGSFAQEPYAIELILRGHEGSDESATVQHMEAAVLDAVYLVKSSSADIDDLDINVKYPLTNKDGIEEDQFALKANFSGTTISDLEGNRSSAATDELSNLADSWWKHPVLDG